MLSHFLINPFWGQRLCLRLHTYSLCSALHSADSQMHVEQMNIHYSWKGMRTSLTFIDHLLFSKHCIVHIIGIISINLENWLISNLPNVAKLLSGSDWSQPRLFMTPKTVLIKKKESFKSHKNVPQRPFTIGRVADQRAPHISWRLSGPLTTISTLHRGHASHSCSPPVTEGSRDDNAGRLWVKDKIFIDCMASEDVSFLFNSFSTPSLFHWSKTYIQSDGSFSLPPLLVFPS